ncbi:MAG: serine hydrolase domain-containing protein, partial [Lysobacterales bacterium]
DTIVYFKSFGFADIATNEPMKDDSIFRIASMSKAITSVAVMTLYEQGLFQLNDPVSMYLPEFKNPQVIEVDRSGHITGTRPAIREIRIIDLLTHSSGIGYPFIPGALQKTYVQSGVIDGITSADVSLAEQMHVLAQQPLLFDPGSDFAYGLSTDVLGYLVEVLSGQNLDQFFQQQIFVPLAMRDTGFYLPKNKSDRLVTLYAHEPGGALKPAKGDESEIKVDNPRYPVEGARSYFSGGAGLSSTAYDYARFLQMLLNEGRLDGNRVLGRKSVELMRTARTDDNDDGQVDFGLGFEVIDTIGVSGELGTEGAYSWGGAWYTWYWVDPAENLVGVFMSQVRPVQATVGQRFKTLVYQALE